MLKTTTGPSNLITSAQDFTSAWADLGSEIETNHFQRINLWLEIDINGAKNVRIRMLAKHAADHANEYCFPIWSVKGNVANIKPEYVEFSDNIDQNILLSWDLDGLVPITQFQIQAKKPGKSPNIAQLTTCKFTMGY